MSRRSEIIDALKTLSDECGRHGSCKDCDSWTSGDSTFTIIGVRISIDDSLEMGEAQIWRSEV